MSAGVIPVGLSTSSVFPEPTERAFALAADLGYDGVEVMVTADHLTQDPLRLRELADVAGVPVLSVHAPSLAISAPVWGTDPIGKIERSVALAAELGATTVVSHPPFRWQRGSNNFPVNVARISAAVQMDYGITIAIENMYPVRIAGIATSPYRPHWDVTATGYPAYTLDLSHSAVARISALQLAHDMGERLAHIHLGDGTGLARDEHLVPGRGTVECAEILSGVADGTVGARRAGGGYAGSVIVEVSTRSLQPDQRRADLAEALAFARAHLATSDR